MPSNARSIPWRRRLQRSAIAAFVAVATSAPAIGASLAPGVQQRLSGATFEVVLGKPQADPLTYEKPLPLALLPFRERTDKYQAIGTAFAVGPNRFATAGHVIAAGSGSQYGPLALRDSSGKVYLVDTVVKYSGAEDYAVFTVQDPPAVAPLETRARPALNQPVFAVGDAYGEGIVIRDGLYTSDTPEELDGRWRWLRFSAAASPGNSGGPLVDRNGKVIGVILRKSPNENLNFAVAIDQVLNGSDEWGVLESRYSYRMGVMKASDAIIFKGKVALPKPISEFYDELQAAVFESYTRANRDYVEHHGASLFPHGAPSAQLLNTTSVATFPRLIVESDSGVWNLAKDEPRRVQLEHNGYVEIGAGGAIRFVRLKTPDGVGPANLLTDSKGFMDTLLKGMPLQRPVGADSVRVTSLGAAQQERVFTDEYGRAWQLRTWLMPFSDSVAITMALPTPDGCALMLASVSTTQQTAMRDELKWMTGFVYLTYEGTLKQWQDYLAQVAILPAALRALKIQFDYGRGIGFRSTRFQLVVPSGLQKIETDSVLMLKFSFFPDGDKTVWDVGAIYLAENKEGTQWIEMQRRPRPPPALPDEFATTWRALTSAGPPWNATLYVANGRFQIAGLANLEEVRSGKHTVGYAIIVSVDGPRTPAAMTSKLKTLQHALTVFER
jgi:serine protease Do